MDNRYRGAKLLIKGTMDLVARYALGGLEYEYTIDTITPKRTPQRQG
jgi:hypothetical protein